jgi:hypothetical protein
MAEIEAPEMVTERCFEGDVKWARFDGVREDELCGLGGLVISDRRLLLLYLGLRDFQIERVQNDLARRLSKAEIDGLFAGEGLQIC